MSTVSTSGWLKFGSEAFTHGVYRWPCAQVESARSPTHSVRADTPQFCRVTFSPLMLGMATPAQSPDSLPKGDQFDSKTG